MKALRSLIVNFSGRRPRELAVSLSLLVSGVRVSVSSRLVLCGAPLGCVRFTPARSDPRRLRCLARKLPAAPLSVHGLRLDFLFLLLLCSSAAHLTATVAHCLLLSRPRKIEFLVFYTLLGIRSQ